MKNGRIFRTAAIVVGFISLFMLSGCELPASWYDPAYFGDGKDLGKDMNSTGITGSGTGYETWNPSL